jgi:hypothetical protein
MNATAGTNPEPGAVTEVIWGRAKEATQAGPMSLGYGEARGEEELAGLVEGLGGEWEHGDLSDKSRVMGRF